MPRRLGLSQREERETEAAIEVVRQAVHTLSERVRAIEDELRTEVERRGERARVDATEGERSARPIGLESELALLERLTVLEEDIRAMTRWKLD
jgi:hypothetical protein